MLVSRRHQGQRQASRLQVFKYLWKKTHQHNCTFWYWSIQIEEVMCGQIQMVMYLQNTNGNVFTNTIIRSPRKVISEREGSDHQTPVWKQTKGGINQGTASEIITKRKQKRQERKITIKTSTAHNWTEINKDQLITIDQLIIREIWKRN